MSKEKMGTMDLYDTEEAGGRKWMYYLSSAIITGTSPKVSDLSSESNLCKLSFIFEVLFLSYPGDLETSDLAWWCPPPTFPLPQEMIPIIYITWLSLTFATTWFPLALSDSLAGCKFDSGSTLLSGRSLMSAELINLALSMLNSKGNYYSTSCWPPAFPSWAIRISWGVLNLKTFSFLASSERQNPNCLGTGYWSSC